MKCKCGNEKTVKTGQVVTHEIQQGTAVHVVNDVWQCDGCGLVWHDRAGKPEPAKPPKPEQPKAAQ